MSPGFLFVTQGKGLLEPKAFQGYFRDRCFLEMKSLLYSWNSDVDRSAQQQ